MAEAPSTSALRPGQRVHGLRPDQLVTLTAITPVADGIVELIFRDEHSELGSRMMTDAELATLRVAQDADQAPAFDGDPDEYRLAAEALRINYAALYDPMVAVSSSVIEPLPHQIRAVYEELLPRVPLRFLLADDPGAGKTIMAGLYLKELLLRSDCERAIIVAPGGLVEQWREELLTKFDLRFEVFNRLMVDDAEGHNVFSQHPYLIVRMDQVSRNEDLMEQLAEVAWDVAVVDEAHRMSARFSSWAGEVEATKRYRLGQLLSETANNLLLMTATPHAGKEEDFQLFMQLLDRDRFEGQYREEKHRSDTVGLMRRMVKEDLLTFEGKPLFPERHAYTVGFELSPAETELYEQVTEYVRTEMGRADRLTLQDNKRKNNVGFALTVLQRRLASSPEAILRSLERRQNRLRTRLIEVQRAADGARLLEFAETLPELDVAEIDDLDIETAEDERGHFESQIEQVVDLATAAQTVGELRTEIAVLDDLIRLARSVRMLDEDKKWVELRGILESKILADDGSGSPHKIIIFTEHRDTLDYLQQKITSLLGRVEAVATIHGGTSRDERKHVREEFTENPRIVVLLATDAAGEGLNLQRAHLMVNYDLPWNPNRIEQRFGRIHRIGQQEVCHLWNMVALDTREGDVFIRLLQKIEQQGKAYNGNLFNVLGDEHAFGDESLRDLLIEAIRYGDRPEVRRRLEQTIDEGVSTGLRELTAERALHPEMFPLLNLEEVREQMERARERKLQPGYIRAFFTAAFERLGGRVHRRETGRFQITRVPSRIQQAARKANRWAPVAEAYERVTFEPDYVRRPGQVEAALIAPGHPLLQAVIDLTLEDLEPVLRRGTIFVDRREEQSSQPALLFAVEQKIENATNPAHGSWRHFDYVQLTDDGGLEGTGAPPYLDFEPPLQREAEGIDGVVTAPWLRQNHDQTVRAWAFRHLQPEIERRKKLLDVEIERTRKQVRDRLLAEINFWEREYNELEAKERQGIIGRRRSVVARQKADQLERRLADRTAELDQAADLVGAPPAIRSLALVVPSELIQPNASDDGASTQLAREAIERRAIDAVLAAESALGRTPQEMTHNNPGFDIRSSDSTGRRFYIEVKGRIQGADTFTITANEVAFAQTQKDRYRLALVSVHPDDAAGDQVCYVTEPFDHLDPADTTRSLNELWSDYWGRGGPPR